VSDDTNVEWSVEARGRFMGAMLTLAQFPLGRMLLHLIAMAGDRCFRFHAQGIVREMVVLKPSFVRASTGARHG
jgi:hypothetical protein